MQRHNRRSRGLALAGSLLIGMAAVAGTVSAHSGHGHPTLIHEGTCDALGKVVYTLNGVGAAEDEHGKPIATPEAVNPRGAYQVMIGETEIDAKLADLLAKPLAVMVYNDDESMQGIACGNLGGARLGDELIVGLAEVNVPGHSGFAIFEQGKDETDVTVLIGHGLAPVSAGGASHDDMAGMGTATPGHDDGDGHHAPATPAASS